MKPNEFLGVAFICLIFGMGACSSDAPVWQLTDLNVKNMNNEGEQPFVSDDSIRKEAYAIDILYVGWNLDNKADYSRIDFRNCKDTIVEQKIICNTDLNSEYAAGSDVTGLFRPLYGTFTGSSGSKRWHGGTFILKHIPNPGIHSFKVLVYLANGAIVEKNLKPVKLY
jgi:hypothetical protein